MPSTPKSVAQDEWFHLLLTIWRSEDHRRLGGDAITAASGVLTGTGAMIEVDGRVYPPVLQPGIGVRLMYSILAQSVTISLLWDRDSQGPIDWDARWAVGELARIDETSGGTAVAGWGSRLRLVRGRVSRPSWGDSYERVTFTLSGTQAIDRGDWYKPGAELSVDRHADIANTGDRDRARNSDGLLPPRVWAPVGSQIRSPALIVKDEVDASSGVSNIVGRRMLLSYDPVQTSSSEQFQVRDSDHEGRFLGGIADTLYRGTPVAAADSLGDRHYYAVQNFAESFGSASVSFTNGSPLGTVTRARRNCRIGWQVKGSTGGNDDYLVAISRDGSSIELGDSSETPVNYGGPTITNGTGNAIPLPPDTADCCFWIPTLNGAGSASDVVSVLLEWLTYAQFDVSVARGDLDAMEGKLRAIDISYVRRQRGSPWAKCLEVLEYLPIRPYIYDGVLRFKWRGPPTEADIVATVDLDEERGLYRRDDVEWAMEGVPIVEMEYWWDIAFQRYTRTVTIDGGSEQTPRRRTCGRAERAWQEWREVTGCRRVEQAPRKSVAYDTLETTVGSKLAALWVLYRWALSTQRIVLAADATWRWLMPGHAMRITQTDATQRSQRWWVESVPGAGEGDIILEGIT